MGHGFQYQFWTEIFACDFGGFSRSTDGGAIWQSPISIPNSPQWGTLDVASNGDLFIGGGNSGSAFWCLRSTNAKNPNVTPTFDQVTTVNMGGSLVYGGTVNPGGLAGQIFIAVDRSGGPTNNNIYMMASVSPSGGGTNVMFARSTNGGASFSAPIRINDDPVNSSKWHWFGTLSVAPNGRIDSVWFDTRNAANNTDSQLFYSYSTDGGVTWAPNVAVSAPFNPLEGWPSQNKIGDYITIISDNTGGDVAYSATFNFNPSRGARTRRLFRARFAIRRSDADSDGYRYAHSNSNSDTDSNTNGNSNSDGYSYCHTDGYGDAYCYSYCYHYAKRYSYGYTLADTYTFRLAQAVAYAED